MKRFHVFYLLQLAHSALFRACDQALKGQLGLSSTQNAVLFALLQQDGQPITAIAEMLKMGKSSLTGLIDRMAAAGLVLRQPSPDDGRSTCVYITDLGAKFAAQTKDATKAVNDQLIADFTDAERATIERFLRHVATRSPDIVQTTLRIPTPERKSA